MFRLVTTPLLYRYFKPKIMNIDALIRKTNLQQPHPKPTSPNLPQRTPNSNKNEGEVSFANLRYAIEHQKVDLTREEQVINHQIKIQTKATQLYLLLKRKSLTFTEKNLVNLLIKVLELRQINPRDSEETEKFHKLLQRIGKRVRKMAPEQMIRLLYSMKRVKMLNSDLKSLSPLIRTILQEFSSRVDSNESEFSSFQVISVDSNIKLLHSLAHLHSISGGQYEPTVLQLIRGSLLHFHKITAPREGESFANKTVKWYFYFGFVQLCTTYQLPIEVLRSFIRAINSLKAYYINRHNLLSSLQNTLHSAETVRQHCRGNKIADFREIFHFHLHIFENIQKPNQIIKMRPVFLLRHIESLNDFTAPQIATLQFTELREITLHRILLFTYRAYEKYFTKHYLNLVEKSNIEKWVQDGQQHNQQFLGSILTLYSKLIAQKKVNCINEYNKLLSLCLQFFQALSFNSQATLVRIGIICSFKNIKLVLDLFFSTHHSANRPQKSHFRKHQEVLSYLQLFPHWPAIQQKIKLPQHTHLEGSFLKMFFTRIIHLPNLEKTAALVAQRVAVDRQFLSLLVKKYIRSSEENRMLGSKFLDMVQTSEFKTETAALKELIQSEVSDKDKLSPFVRLKYRLREKMKRGLTIFKFFILLLENLNKTLGSPAVDISTSTLFREIYFHFNEEMKCLNYKELATGEVYDLASEICQYLESRTTAMERQGSIVFAIYEREKGKDRRERNRNRQQSLGREHSHKIELILKGENISEWQKTGDHTQRLAYLNRQNGIGVAIDLTSESHLCLDHLIHAKPDAYLTIIRRNINEL